MAVGGDVGGGDEQEEQQARDGVGKEEQQVGDGEKEQQVHPGAGKEGQPSVQVVKHEIIQFNLLSQVASSDEQESLGEFLTSSGEDFLSNNTFLCLCQ